MTSAAEALEHDAFLADGVALAGAELTDRERLALLLQGLALLSHLTQCGWSLASGWSPALVSAGRLRGLAARASAERRPAQSHAREWLARLFGERVPGRGEARIVARRLAEEWARALVPCHPDALLERLLELAPFLWQPAFAEARRAMVARVRRGGCDEVAVAGPARVGRAYRAAAAGAEIVDVVSGPRAGEIWREAWAEGGPPAQRSVRRLAVVTEAGAQRRHEVARALLSIGRYERALDRLDNDRDPEARLLRAAALVRLHRPAAARVQLRALEAMDLRGEPLLQALEIAVTVGHLESDHELPRAWIASALAVTRGPLRRRALIESARAACNRGDRDAALRALQAARADTAEGDLPRRWRRVRFAVAYRLENDGQAALAELNEVMRRERRSLERPEAATHWNDLSVARAAVGDLAGAERALVHASRLMVGCDGPFPLLIAQNLVEIRLRRGRARGVVDWLEHALQVDRANRNVPGMAQGLEMLARQELIRGRLFAALDRVREALAMLDAPHLAPYAPPLHVLAARVRGWMGQPAEAAAALASAGCAPSRIGDSASATGSLEAEERPAVWALAGDREAALAAAAGSCFAPLWEAALSGRPAPAAAWEALSTLEDFRAARLVLDLELSRPGIVPVLWQRRASAHLRRSGAPSLAARLEGSNSAAYRAIAAHCRAAGNGCPPLAQLFTSSGYPEARLTWSRNGEVKVLVPGRGGAEQLETPHAGGRAVLEAPFVDDALRALFALALRDYDGDVAEVDETANADGLIGNHAEFRRALERADRFARGSLPVLVLGESGSGKELVARRIHDRGPRAGLQFLAVNCAATTETLLTSDLFGHARGAFTGADRERKGVFEVASGGTVFLDELGDLPLSAQGMLLRVLQEGEVRRLGESLPRRVDVRVIGATHRDLAAMSRRGEFRQDLYYRLKVATVVLPPLRERGDDVMLLARRFLPGWRPGLRLSNEAREMLLRHDWPGNVRELRNVLEAAAALSDGDVIKPEHLDLPASGGARRTAANYHLEVDAVRRRLLEEALAASGGRRAEAARRLGLSRQALSYLLRQLGTRTAPKPNS